MMLPRLLYSLASILILFFGEFSNKESGKLASVAMIAVDKGMTGGRCRTEETKLPYGPEKLEGDEFTWLCKWRNYQKEEIMSSLVIDKVTNDKVNP